MIKTKLTSELAQFDAKLVKKIAKDWVEESAKLKGSDSVMILYDIGGRQLATEVAKLCAKKGCRVWYRVRDLDVEADLIDTLSERNLNRYFANLDNEIYQADSVFMIRAARDNNIMAKVSESGKKIYSKMMKPVYMDYRVNFTNWQLMYWPTEAEAAEEGIAFDEYVKMFFDACNQDWAAIKKANQVLCEVLNKGKMLELFANSDDKDPMRRTHVKMSIDGMEFMNSTIDRNYPGSEVFSSPVKTSVNGQVYKMGPGSLAHEGKVIEDVYFKIKNGKIVEAKASKGEKDMNAVLDRDEGARYFGEIAFGTNPGLRRRVFNGLLNEKIGGSFHITPGNAYDDMADTDGKIIHIDNGNKSEIHWDLTVMMLPEYGGGEVKVDGKTIQKDGKFLLDGLEVLNKGLSIN